MKNYRNVFKEIGKSDDEISKKLEELVEKFFYDSDTRVYFPIGEDMGIIVDTGNNDVRTEGMSYGMMMCVQLDMRQEFDRIWKWAKTYMYMETGENEGYFAWSCKTDGEKNSNGPAPDGEEYFAMSLFFASNRWGDGEGIFCYSQEAKAILRAAVHKGENGRSGKPMWNRDNHYILFVPGSSFTDPSYHLPHFYELFSIWADKEDREFWKKAAEESRKFLIKACHPVTGMNPEYANFDGTPVKEVFSWGRHDWFYSDSYRTAANIGLDFQWFGKDVGQTAAAAGLQHFLLVTRRENPWMSYEVDGTVQKEKALHPVGLLAATAAGTLALKERLDNENLSEQGKLSAEWVEKFWNEPLRVGERRYYDNCLYMFAFLALSGRYRIWDARG